MPDQSPPPESLRKLKRSSSDRMLAGVCGGLGNYFSVDPLILRIAFGVSVFFGGLGVVLYLAVAALVPVDDAPDGKPLISLDRSSTMTVVVVVAVLVVAIPILGALFAWIGDPSVFWFAAAVIIVVAAITFWRERDGGARPGARSGPPSPSQRPGPAARQTATETAETSEIGTDPATGPGSPGAPTEVRERIAAPAGEWTSGPAGERPQRRSNLLTVLLVCGVSILSVAAFFAAALTVGFGLGPLVAAMIVAGGLAVFALAFASVGGARWLVVPLLAVVLGGGAAEAADLDLQGGVGEETYRPREISSIPADGYRLGVGHLAVDLRELPWRDGEVVPVRASAGVGFLEVVVPSDVCVAGAATSRAGYVTVAGDEESGFDARSEGLAPRDPGSSGSSSISRDGSDRDQRSQGGKRGMGASGDRVGISRPPTLEIDASVDFGAIQVRNDGSAPETDEPGRISSDSRAEMRRLNERACAG